MGWWFFLLDAIATGWRELPKLCRGLYLALRGHDEALAALRCLPVMTPEEKPEHLRASQQFYVWILSMTPKEERLAWLADRSGRRFASDLLRGIEARGCRQCSRSYPAPREQLQHFNCGCRIRRLEREPLDENSPIRRAVRDWKAEENHRATEPKSWSLQAVDFGSEPDRMAYWPPTLYDRLRDFRLPEEEFEQQYINQPLEDGGIQAAATDPWPDYEDHMEQLHLNGQRLLARVSKESARG